MLHNFAFTEPMRSLGSRVVGTIADTIGVVFVPEPVIINESHVVGTIADTIGVVFVPEPVIINEIDNASDLPDSEWMELRNLNDGELNLKGWTAECSSTHDIG